MAAARENDPSGGDRSVSFPTRRRTLLLLLEFLLFAFGIACKQRPVEDGPVGFDITEFGPTGDELLVGLILFCLILAPAGWFVVWLTGRSLRDSTWKLIRYGWPTLMAAWVWLIFSHPSASVAREVITVAFMMVNFPVIVFGFLMMDALGPSSQGVDSSLPIVVWLCWYLIVRLLERYARGKTLVALNLKSSK